MDKNSNKVNKDNNEINESTKSSNIETSSASDFERKEFSENSSVEAPGNMNPLEHGQDKNLEKIGELELQLKKSLADYQNLKREMDKRLDFETSLLRTDLVRQVINVADDIDMAVDRVTDEKGWRDGILQILEKFRSVITNLGAEIIECKKGDKFDANVHEAIGTLNEGKDGHIARVIQSGYKIGDIIIRPTRVIVSKANSTKK
ncbi:nucleotide exchange factor GrpE [Candidatus Dojkabacteria bacterium]|nr:nucleotide exchange factor GrpE [Candidatus Dojkabacteria bacterium]